MDKFFFFKHNVFSVQVTLFKCRVSRAYVLTAQYFITYLNLFKFLLSSYYYYFVFIFVFNLTFTAQPDCIHVNTCFIGFDF